MVTSIPRLQMSHTKNFLSSERRGPGEGGGALGKGAAVGVSVRWVSLFYLPPFASATRVSHGMRRHQIFNEHAAKKEEWCPPGQRAGTLNWSRAAHQFRGG